MEKKKRQADYFSFFNEELYLPPVFRRGQNELNYAGIFFFFKKSETLENGITFMHPFTKSSCKDSEDSLTRGRKL